MRYLLLACLCFSLLQCSVEDAELEGTIWRVTRFTNGEGETKRNRIGCFASFNEGSAVMNIGANQCFCSYSLMSNAEILLEEAACTSACCSKKNAEEAAHTITMCTRFSIDGQTLLLTGEDGIEVKLVVD